LTSSFNKLVTVKKTPPAFLELAPEINAILII